MGETNIIRKAEKRDIGILADLLGSLFAIETDFAIDVQSQQQGLLLLLEEPERACIMVAERDNRIVGMCTGQILVSTAAGGLKVIVEDVVVAQGMRGRGIGTELITAIEHWSRACGVKRMDLLADRRNSPALDFYRQRDWRSTELVALQKPLLV
ncbi:MAG: GCN5-related N-acetyltransferase [Firmicutes bacterium]|nr:GCN5-related N-acetyltransferase [Bacillota bacterium]